MNKKGFVYLISSVFLVAVLFAIIISTDENFFRDKQSTNSQRIIYINDFVKGFNQDYERAVHIASFRTMIALEDHIASTGTFLNNTEESFKETFYNGTIKGEECQIMNDSAIKDYLSRAEQISSRLGISINITVINIHLSQSSPWMLDVESETEITIKDYSNTANWTYNKTFLVKVPIDNLRDPLYSVFTHNRLSNTIRKSNITYFVSPSNNTDNLSYHIEHGYYIVTNKAPNFIMRFENNFTPNENGIESIVNIQSISDQDLTVYPNRIKVDYIYFNYLNYSKICDFDFPEELEDFELVLTPDRASLYDVDQLDYSTTCE